MTDRNRKVAVPSTSTVKGDAKGQFAPVQSGENNDGAASAEPRVLRDGEAMASDWDEDEDASGSPSLPNRPR
ncbi:hypothetical protein LB518_20455 [Mesorhizobium sp. BR1-1-16]|uniref:hypothetical protein n=1 Tax=Mesorhizobium sp. BR1-1-16 TaxID=2876653 RepID=UPI001CD03567|nr:hypothetical protein [Mesorhizobium sp. BR1-1-16]MBZ9938680.1 hypothetical protein [Mesorhizobium sp. BR1-1-16]